MGELHDALEESGYTGHDLERYLVRLLFCLFADDTGIFEPRDIMVDLIEQRTAVDGSDTGQWLHNLFEVLNTEEDKRLRTLDEDLAQFPYVNGDLFAERLSVPAFDTRMRQLLINACNFQWEAISPAIFGALFQSVMRPDERRQKGGHYTTEKNILKVIGPLFLDELWEEFEQLKSRKRDKVKPLYRFHEKLAGMRFLDPACGCGNFLIITYRELRQLELEVLRELRTSGQLEVAPERLSKINVDQFYGIEIEEFPARIAETALWMMDHIMNNRLSLEFGEVYARIPLKKSPHIHCTDALEIDWTKVLSAEKCSYVFGNPPFGGFHFRTEHRQNQMARVVRLGASGNRIDYVAAWFLKAADFVQSGEAAIAFVATNSITQGEQVAQIWPALFDRYKLEIAFAHRTFAWGSDARGRAHVHVVIVGLAKRGIAPQIKRLFSYDDYDGDAVESRHAALSPYLFDAARLANPHLVVHRARYPLNGFPPICVGSKPVDGGHYIMDESARQELLNREPKAIKVVRPFVGGREHLSGDKRWILFPEGLTPQELRKMPTVMERVVAVKHYRETAEGNLARELASNPTRYHVTVIPDTPFLALPEVSSEHREYLPIGWIEPPAIPSNKLLVVLDATLDLFAILSSRMHMSWLRNIGGRLESRFQYSGGIVYNPFPVPEINESTRARLITLGQAVIDARSIIEDASLADLYDPDVMPARLRQAHRDVDNAVDRLYRSKSFEGDRERVEHLFGLYEKLVAPLAVAAKPERKRRVAKA